MQYDILGEDITWFNGRNVNKATSVRAKVTATCCCSSAHVDYGTAHSVSIVNGEWVPATINRLFSLLDSVEKFVINSYLKF